MENPEENFSPEKRHPAKIFAGHSFFDSGTIPSASARAAASSSSVVFPTVVPVIAAMPVVVAIAAFPACLVPLAAAAVGTIRVAGALFTVALLAAALHFRFAILFLLSVLSRKGGEGKCSDKEQASKNELFHNSYLKISETHIFSKRPAYRRHCIPFSLSAVSCTNIIKFLRIPNSEE